MVNKEKPNLSEAYKDIMSLKLEPKHTLEEIMNMFYDICTKYGIKQGTPNYDDEGNEISITCNNPEWSMMLMALEKQVNFYFSFAGLGLFGIPKHLEA